MHMQCLRTPKKGTLVFACRTPAMMSVKYAAACRLGKFSAAELRALASVYTHFQAASMDFLQLAGLDYGKSLTCECEGPCQAVTADGTTISCQAANLCQYAPWMVDLEEDQLTHGSAFAQRILVRSARARELLRDFARKQGGGVDLDELTNLLCEAGLRCLAEVVSAAASPLPNAADSLHVCRAWARSHAGRPRTSTIHLCRLSIHQHLPSEYQWGVSDSNAQKQN